MKQGRKKQGKVCPEIRMFRVGDDNNDVRGERDGFIAEQDTRHEKRKRNVREKSGDLVLNASAPLSKEPVLITRG